MTPRWSLGSTHVDLPRPMSEMDPSEDAARLLRRSAAFVLEHLPDVDPEKWSRPTPCKQWDLGALLNHFNVSLTFLRRLALPLDSEVIDLAPGDVVGSIRVHAGSVSELWAQASLKHRLCDVDGGLLWASTVNQVAAVELVLHCWDVRTSLGLRTAIPPELATSLLDIAPKLVMTASRKAEFGPAVPVSSNATPSDRLVAFLGRGPRATVGPDSY